MSPFPDALMLPQYRKIGLRMVDRVASIADIAEPLLGVNRKGREGAHIRLQKDGRLFITKSIFDTLNYPTDHPFDGHPRYAWVKQPDGSEWGYLLAESARLEPTLVRRRIAPSPSFRSRQFGRNLPRR
jgi:hypothetical protein